MAQQIEFFTEYIPEPGEVYEISPGILWIRMPLPFKLNHINLWLLEDDDGWTMVDTGINDDRTKDLWRIILGRVLKGKPLSKLVCTHAHPDHIGLGGWVCDEYGAELFITREEWAFGRVISTGVLKDKKTYDDFFLRLGCDKAHLNEYGEHVMTAEQLYCSVPHRYQRLREGSTIQMGGKSWEVIVGLGHSNEHACLYCADLNVLIAGDQVLPKITPTIMVQANEPEANPLLDFLESNEKLRYLPESVTILPSHNRPFRGLQARLDQYSAHHSERLDVVLGACDEPRSGLEITNILFPQDLDFHGMYFATGEAIAHIRYLENERKLSRTNDVDGIERYCAIKL
jgi:glyoxylase-like metal-dependent hydrolase (beta-lactamase superfamily II)